MSDVEGFVFYDANCRFCVRLARWAEPWLADRRFRLLPLQTPWCGHKLGLTDAELLVEMRLLLPDGQRFGGTDALLEISRHFWWAWPIRQMARLPVMMRIFRASYRWIARHHGCADGTCAVATVGDLPSVKHYKQRTIAFLDMP
jgi:predicted DCC family thiol-disulfide oxidoreductase YuxK